MGKIGLFIITAFSIFHIPFRRTGQTQKSGTLLSIVKCCAECNDTLLFQISLIFFFVKSMFNISKPCVFHICKRVFKKRAQLFFLCIYILTTLHASIDILEGVQIAWLYVYSLSSYYIGQIHYISYVRPPFCSMTCIVEVRKIVFALYIQDHHSELKQTLN